ncbi:hypothetical protein [Nostoc sp. PA-18-2419]|uniref:hypothetical protein n=1 Tax=Nostoc sp. PA-18-2419 TaxID=2575443 RepID=UPI00167AAE48|nr:hypothetical protein [Nostoc sp. PA-18-2419]
MSRIKITDLQPDNQVEERKLSQLELMTIIGGIQLKLLGNNILDATFGGFRLII